MPSSVDTIIRKQYVSLIAAYAEEYEAVGRALTTTIDPAALVRLRRKLADLEQQMKDADASLRGLDGTDTADDANRAHLDWSRDLYKIDYVEPDEQLLQLRLLRRRSYLAALLLVEHGEAMCADLLLSRLREEHLKPHGRDHYCEQPLEFNSWDTLSPETFLSALAAYFPPPAATAGAAELDAVLATLVGSLGGASVRLLPIRVTNDPDSTLGFLCWLADTFWPQLTAALQQRESELRQVQLVFVVELAEGSLDPGYLPRCCTVDTFGHGDRPLRLPLDPWSELDIQDWLTAFSPLGRERQKDWLSQRAQRIFHGTRGRPRSVRSQLEALHRNPPP